MLFLYENRCFSFYPNIFWLHCKSKILEITNAKNLTNDVFNLKNGRLVESLIHSLFLTKQHVLKPSNFYKQFCQSRMKTIFTKMKVLAMKLQQIHHWNFFCFYQNFFKIQFKNFEFFATLFGVVSSEYSSLSSWYLLSLPPGDKNANHKISGRHVCSISLFMLYYFYCIL